MASEVVHPEFNQVQAVLEGYRELAAAEFVRLMEQIAVHRSRVLELEGFIRANAELLGLESDAAGRLIL